MHPQEAQSTCGVAAGHDSAQDPGWPGHSIPTGWQGPPETSHAAPEKPPTNGQGHQHRRPAPQSKRHPRQKPLRQVGRPTLNEILKKLSRRTILLVPALRRPLKPKSVAKAQPAPLAKVSVTCQLPCRAATYTHSTAYHSLVLTSIRARTRGRETRL